jgi:hypothetical protein
MKRIYFIDFLRGIAILFMMFFHGFQFYDGNFASVESNLGAPGVAAVFKFLGRWAGLFALISGYVNAMTMHDRIVTGKNKPKETLYGALITGFWFILMNIFCSAFLGGVTEGGGQYGFDAGIRDYSFIVGYLETGSPQVPSIYKALLHQGIFTMIGISIIASGTLLYFLCRKSIPSLKKMIWTYGILGTFIVLFGPIIVNLLRPVWVNALIEENYFLAIAIGWMVGDIHSFFPLAGFAFYGAMFGLASRDILHQKYILKLGRNLSLFYICFGAYLFMLLGDPPLETILQPPSIQSTYLMIGLMLLIVCVLFYLEYIPRDHLQTKFYQNITLRRFGIASMTIFALEAFVGTLIKVVIIDPLFPGWNRNMAWVVVYSFALILLWHLILKAWERNDLKGSFEWVTYRVLGIFMKSKSKNLKIRELLYGSSDRKQPLKEESPPMEIVLHHPMKK